MAPPKLRLDQLLVEKGLIPTRQKSRATVLAGLVMVNGQRVDKAGTLVPVDAVLTITRDVCPYVSRGGFKLARALAVFGLDLKGSTILDVGASTGGFTDVALQHGASRVIAVDVGYGQLAWSLRTDPRVRCLERTNIRYLTRETLGELADLATIDVSFISLTKVLPAVFPLLHPSGQAIALVKPQFEAGREKVGKKGVVRDPSVHQEVLTEVIFAATTQGWQVAGLTYSPVTGPQGNIEFLLWLQKASTHAGPVGLFPEEVAVVVAQAQTALKKG
ncbi:MAG: TlyA family RNA methyltransferase [Heliobacteriaceae bacterium]|nr:TlyA family RNA methyltransferase [Heliobacteriaceae bacterium]MDD4587280.1 TlyA family RNA methyltransferase [Heliobacteriaceae bacterium]